MHFTYNDDIDKSTLMQGDIIIKTPEILETLKEIHPHYVNEEYTHFQILTQSCDLVRRGKSKKSSTRYISIAAVRSLNTVLIRIINDKATTKKFIIENTIYCSEKHKEKLSSALGKIFNNNDKDVFYLQPEPTCDLPVASCTFLHLSIALKAKEHYDKLLVAKRLELKEGFRAKLGWLVGNLYSRVGTPDYVDSLEDKKQFIALLDKTLDEHIAWVPDHLYSHFKNAFEDLPEQSWNNLLQQASTEYLENKKTKIDRLSLLIKREIQLSSAQEENLKKVLYSEAANKIYKNL